MSSRQNLLYAGRHGWRNRGPVVLMAMALCVGATGCLSSLARHSSAVAVATAPVIDEAETAYRGAQRLHDLKVDYATADAFEATKKIDRTAIVSFPSDEAIQVRLTVLEAFKCYVESVVEITGGFRSPELDAASKSIGSSLTAVGNGLAPTIEDLLHIEPPVTTNTTTYTTDGRSTTTSASVAAPLIPVAGQNAVSTAALALGEFLVSRKVKKQLPAKIKTMDKVMEALCIVLESDIDILQKQEQRDLEAISDGQTLFLQSPAGAMLEPQQRRTQIMVLPEMIRKQRETDEQLARLKAAIARLAMTHHALASDAQDNNPKSLKAKLGELAAAGSDLGKFYSSLPMK